MPISNSILRILIILVIYWQASQVAQWVHNLPATQETWVRSLGLENPLGKNMAAHSSILGWRIPWTEEPRGWQSTGLKELGQTETTEHVHNFLAGLIELE